MTRERQSDVRVAAAADYAPLAHPPGDLESAAVMRALGWWIRARRGTRRDRRQTDFTRPAQLVRLLIGASRWPVEVVDGHGQPVWASFAQNGTPFRANNVSSPVHHDGMTNSSSQPDGAARLVSHALVGIAAAGVVSLVVARQHSPEAQLLGALVAVLMHEYFDAPMATKLADFSP